MVHQRTLRPQFLLSTMSDYKVTLMTMVPMLLDLFRKRIEGKIAALPVWKRLMLQGLIAVNRLFTWRHPCLGLSRALLRPLHEGLGGHLRLVIAGGAPTDPSTVRFFYSIGIPVCVGYGLSEAGVAVTVNRPDDLRYDSVGTTLEGTEVRVNAPGADGCGALWVRGPTVMRGYWNEEELTANTLIDGWLHTGDLARLDKHRHLHIYGRMKNMIVTAGGKNVYPEDVEFRFDKVAGCAELAVFAAPALGVQREELVLVYRVNEGASESELLDSFQERNRGLSEYQRISRFLCWEAEFPRTSSMKLKREQLLDSLKQKEVLQ